MKNIGLIIRIVIIAVALIVLGILVVPDMVNQKMQQSSETEASSSIAAETSSSIAAEIEEEIAAASSDVETTEEIENEMADAGATGDEAVENAEVETLPRPTSMQMQFSIDDSVIFKIYDDDVRILRSDAYKYEDGSINSDAVWEFVDGISSNYGYTCTGGETITDPSTGGLAMGKYVASNATYQAVVDALYKSGQNTTYVQWYYEPFVGKGQGTYIEINITEQHLWYFKNSSLFLDTDIVTGLNDAEHATPTGTFKIQNKSTNTRLQGTMGDDSWDEVVNYWMAVTTDGIGIHDAPWRDYFGGNIYQYGGSHGCINVPYSKMATLFANVSVGTTVIITY